MGRTIIYIFIKDLLLYIHKNGIAFVATRQFVKKNEREPRVRERNKRQRLWVIPISVLVNRIVPDPYMDEIFHIPQAQQYCNGDFRSWDPMITTPPGLYLLSLAYVKTVSFLSPVCSTAVLRSVNGVLAVLCSVIVFEIIRHLRPGIDERRATVFTVVLALYPLHWFFSFLYYTDAGSLMLVLATYLACLKRKYYSSALLGAFAVLMRQTNAIWMLFVACTSILDTILAHQKGNVKTDVSNLSIKTTGQLNFNSRVATGSNIRRRKVNADTESTEHPVICQNVSSMTQSQGLFDELQGIILTAWHMKWELLFSFSPFFMVFATLVAFVCWNGSVVLGAKEAHAVSPHFAQIMYFSLVCSLASAPLHFSLGQGADMLQSLWRNKACCFLQWLIALTAGFLSVHFFSIAHPYLLADNRHYTFYLWRKFIKAHWLKYLLVPLYVYSWFSIFRILGKARSKIWILAYFLATAAVLVPAPLVEFRYYTIPFYFLMLHSRIDDYRNWVLMGLVYTVINGFTMMMFLFRPFHWSHEPGIQRFIW